MIITGRPGGASSARAAAALVGLLGAFLLMAVPAMAQYRLSAPSGETVTFSRDSVEAMLARTRALYDTLEADPRIVYYVGYGVQSDESRPGPAYPWNAVTVRSDSAVRVVTPDNLREASRAYYNYAVMRMRERGPTAARDVEEDCGDAVAREARLLSSFADGWIVTRTLFGGPAYPPLTEIAFAREAGHLEAYAVDHDLPQLDRCADPWREAHPDRLEAYRRWRDSTYLDHGASPGDSASMAVHSLRGS